MASQPILQRRIRYLKYEVGERHLLDLVTSGKTLDEIVEEVDPAGLEGISPSVLSRFLGGLVPDRTSHTPDTGMEPPLRRVRYKEARRLLAAKLAGLDCRSHPARQKNTLDPVYCLGSVISPSEGHL